MQVDIYATRVFEVCPVLSHYIGAHDLFRSRQGAGQGRGLFVLRGHGGTADDRCAGFVSAVIDGALMLLLRMAVGSWAPLRSILDPAGWTADRKAAFPSAFIRGAIRVEKVLAIASESKRKKQ